MICKKCGLEYPDDMEACPGCGAPNEEVEAQPMSAGERDSFEGVTIDTGVDDGSGTDNASYRVYDRDDLNREKAQEARKEKRNVWWQLLKNNLGAVALLLLILALVVALLPTLLSFVAIGAAVYLLIAVLNRIFSGL